MQRASLTFGVGTVLDADEVAEYEAWKLEKLTGNTDLSVAAYNREQERDALAWDDGWRAKANGEPISANRFRKPQTSQSGLPSSDPGFNAHIKQSYREDL